MCIVLFILRNSKALLQKRKGTLGWRDPNSTPQYQGTRRTESYQALTCQNLPGRNLADVTIGLSIPGSK
ncbi:unnamed protein product [Caretta caretta]